MEQPELQYFLKKTGISVPLIGFYDTPDRSLFDPLLKSNSCVFANYKHWLPSENKNYNE